MAAAFAFIEKIFLPGDTIKIYLLLSDQFDEEFPQL